MKDLTRGPIPRHLVEMSIPIAVGLLLQTLYYLVDLYFVARLGEAAIAGVSAAGNLWFIVLALTQVLGVSTVALMSHAAGRKDRGEANHVFNQAITLAGVCAGVTLVGGFGFAGWYMDTLGANAATREAGLSFLYAFIPGLALQYPLVVTGSALRATGIVKPGMVVQAVTVLINAALAPVLIGGWGTGVSLGPAGAGWASTIAVALGNAMILVYFAKLEKYVAFDRGHLSPRLATWKRMLVIGIPAGGEFVLMAVYVGLIYWIIRPFGAAAQAGFGLGSRLMQSIFLPAMAVAFAAAPIAGQNYGAKLGERVRATFTASVTGCVAIMLALTLLIQVIGRALIAFFTQDPAVIDYAFGFLSMISWNFAAVGLVFCCSSMFQALGNTWPSLISVGTRLATFAIPALWISMRPGFEIEQIWLLSVVTVWLQAMLSFLLVRQQLGKRLAFTA
jgi:putative MATE family efflux protein